MRGSVEWAPKSDDTDMDHPILIIVLVFCGVIVIMFLFLMKSNSKKYELIFRLILREIPVQNQPVGPFAETQGIL